MKLPQNLLLPETNVTPMPPLEESRGRPLGVPR